MPYGIMRIEKVKAADFGEFSGRLKHSLGEFETKKNSGIQRNEVEGWGEILEGAADFQENLKGYKQVLDDVKHRPDSVGLFEIVMTHSSEGCEDWTERQDREFVERSTEWVRKKFGDANILLAVRHNDETVRHVHFFVTPLHSHTITKGKNRVEKTVTSFDAKFWTGGKDKLRELQNSAFEEVFSHFGFSRGESAEVTHRKNQRPNLNKKAAELTDKETALQQQIQDISEREKKVTAREESLAEEEAQLREREKMLSDAENGLSERVSAINRQITQANEKMAKTAFLNGFDERSEKALENMLQKQTLSEKSSSATLFSAFKTTFKQLQKAVYVLTAPFEKIEEWVCEARQNGCQNLRDYLFPKKQQQIEKVKEPPKKTVQKGQVEKWGMGR